MAVSISPAEQLRTAALDAIGAVNIAVGELALALPPDDRRRAALQSVQGGLDLLWSASGGPEHEALELASLAS